MKRRSLFAMVPATSVLFALKSEGKAIEKAALTPAGFCISVQAWSFKEFTLMEAIEMASKAGASGLEMYPGQKLGGSFGDAKVGPDMPDDQIKAVLEQAKKFNITPVNFGVCGISKDETEARKTFEFAKKLGLYGVTTESLDALDTLEKLAKEYDLKVCFHNHPKPDNPLWNPDTVWNAIQGRHENIGYCADVGHWVTSGLDPLTIVKKIGSRIRSFHMKDREAAGTPTADPHVWYHDRPYGTGIVDIPGILDEARKLGFAGNVSIEYEYNWKESLPEIAQCVGFLRGYAKVRG
jgi:sugar phosphate isomerase/epimerase